MIAIVSRAAALVAAGLLCGGISHWLRFGVPFVRTEQPQLCDAAESIGPIPTIPAAAAAALCADPSVVVLDARAEMEFATGHVAGAYHLPCSAGVIDSDLSRRLDAAETILVYGESSTDAKPVVESLLRRRLADVRFIAGGYAAWEAAGEACASGPCPGCAGDHL